MLTDSDGRALANLAIMKNDEGEAGEIVLFANGFEAVGNVGCK